MPDTFNWRVDIGLSGESEITVARSVFGEGYRQSFPLGLNPKRKTFNVSVSGRMPVIAAVIAFIDAQQGNPFFWRPPFGQVGELYSCVRYSEPRDEGGMFYTLTMVFEQEFAP